MNIFLSISLLLLSIYPSSPWSTEVEDFRAPLKCFIPCPFIVDPVCATNGTAYKAFTNQCFLNAENCAYNSGWREVEALFCKKRTKTTVDACKNNCDHHPAPICGHDGTLYKLFWNNCWRHEEECIDGRKWNQVPIDKCISNTTCGNVCPLHTHHVCASNGETYRWLRNPCVIDLENCRLLVQKNASIAKLWREVLPCKCVHKSEKVLKHKCELHCKPIYTPVCASNGRKRKTFTNSCEMTVYNCLHCSNFTIVQTGRCTRSKI